MPDGLSDELSSAQLRRAYPQFVNHVRIRYIETTPETAESIKYLANTLLLTYISFWNGIGARLSHLLEWLERESPDVACLQELKAPDNRFPAHQPAKPRKARKS